MKRGKMLAVLGAMLVMLVVAAPAQAGTPCQVSMRGYAVDEQQPVPPVSPPIGRRIFGGRGTVDLERATWTCVPDGGEGGYVRFKPHRWYPPNGGKYHELACTAYGDWVGRVRGEVEVNTTGLPDDQLTNSALAVLSFWVQYENAGAQFYLEGRPAPHPVFRYPPTGYGGYYFPDESGYGLAGTAAMDFHTESATSSAASISGALWAGTIHPRVSEGECSRGFQLEAAIEHPSDM